MKGKTFDFVRIKIRDSFIDNTGPVLRAPYYGG